MLVGFPRVRVDRASSPAPAPASFAGMPCGSLAAHFAALSPERAVGGAGLLKSSLSMPSWHPMIMLTDGDVCEKTHTGLLVGFVTTQETVCTSLR